MRIMLLGASGFIGRHILAELTAHGHDVTAVVRNFPGLKDAFPAVCFLEMNLVRATEAAARTSLLIGVDLIVNAAGVLRGNGMEAVHVDMPRALYAAAAAAGVRRAVLISAISARPDVQTDYARSKLEGEAALRNSGVAWTILRPSLVYGDGSYGGTSLLRGMAGLPWMIPIPGDGNFSFTPIHACDLAQAVRIACEQERFSGIIVEPVGPETLRLRELLSRYRAWLAFGKTRFLSIPMPIMRLLGRLGDIVGSGPIATNSLAQMAAGNAGDSATFKTAIGFQPRKLDVALRERPAQIQDRWHARLFFMRPVITAVLVFLWLASGLMGLVYGAVLTAKLVQALGLAPAWADPLRIGTSILDISIAALLLGDRTARLSMVAQLVMVAGYTLVIGFAMPGMWLDPLGPLLKNLPILALILVHGAIGDER